MLKNIKFESKYRDFGIKELGVKLARLQRMAQNLKMPALVIIEGWESSGQGNLIYNLVRELNPKYYDVKIFDKLSDNEKMYLEMTPYWINSPQKSNLQIFDKSYYYELFNKKEKDSVYKNYLEGINNFEKAMYDDYAIVVKFFIQISEKVQKNNIESYLDSDYKSLYVEKLDEDQNKHYDKYLKKFDSDIEKTNFDFAKWHILDGSDIKEASKEAIGILIESFEVGIERMMQKRENGERLNRVYKSERTPLDKIDLSKTLSEEDYDSILKKLQKRASELQLELYKQKISTILVFEGVDAAGKDGSIERLIKYMDPRMVKVHAISAPNEEENRYNYLWRFYKRLPKDGDMGIFSRSWYGRVMVERVEGFAEENEWERAYSEIQNFEREIYDHGSLIIKYFVMIDKDTQLKRFEDREEDPDKQYKITEEDWRNREKWDQYIAAMNEMLDRTSTKYSPWVIVEGNDKNYARIKVLKTFIEYAEKHLNED